MSNNASKTIESMWQNGFLNEKEIIAPKVNDLYNRKSQNIVDKLQHMFKININAIIGGCLVLLVVFGLIGAFWLAVYMCLLLTPLILIARKELDKSLNLSKGLSSYEYLTNFNNWLKESIKTYEAYYQWFYPLLVIGMAVQALSSKLGGELITFLLNKFPTEWVVAGVPYYILIVMAVLTLIAAKGAKALYRWDLNMVYGKQFNRLEELIADMEELRK